MIDKEKVINELKCCTDYLPGNNPMLREALDMAIAMLKEQEPKRGQWIKMTGMMPPEYHGHYECSECQWHMKGIKNSWTREEEMAYCPNCGAKMENGD